jgi:surface carbohydrate biosynthesis protein
MQYVYLMYEIEKREFLSRIFLINEFFKISRKATKIRLFQHTELAKIAMASPPGVVILKSCPDSIYPYIKLLKIRGFKILLFQEEGIHYTEFQVNALEFSSRCALLVDKYLAWHILDFNFAKSLSIPADRILIIGNTRLELAGIMFNRGPTPPTDRLRVLVLENFTSGNMYKTYIPIRKQSKENQVHNILRESNQAYTDNISRNIEIYQDLYKSFLSAGIDFRVRGYTLGVETTKKNALRIDKDYHSNILESLKDRNIVLHYGSTAGLEAIFFGRINITLTSPRAIIRDTRLIESAFHFSKIHELVDFLEKLNLEQILSINTDQKENVYRNYGIRFDKLSSTSLLIEEINSLLSRFNVNKSWSWFHMHVLVFNIKLYFTRKIYSFLAFYFSVFLKIKNVKVQKANPITESEINKTFNLIGANTTEIKLKISINKKSVVFSDHDLLI